MSRGRLLVRRVGFAVVAVYLVVSVAFAVVAFTPDPNEAALAYSVARETGGDSEAVERAVTAYREARNEDDPVLQRYVRWLVDVTTLDWGRSYTLERPVTALVAERLPRTLGYVLPAMVLSAVVGVAAGVRAATDPRSLSARFGATGAYLALSLPNFWLAEVLPVLFVLPLFASGVEPLALLGAFVDRRVLPVAVVATSLVAGQLRYARAETVEYVGTDFVKLVRAKGGGRRRVSRHVLRNALLPLVSLFFTDMLAVLLVNVYVVEQVFAIPGIGSLSLHAIRRRDLPLIVGTTTVVAVVGVAGNLLQDVAYVLLDPRVDAD